jgi:cell pole-organizing protein PopZ
MNRPAKLQVPSMEEVLASIRRIIADEDPAKAPSEPVHAPTPAAAVAPSRTPPQHPPASSSPVPCFEPSVSPAPPSATPAEELASDVLDLTEAAAPGSPAIDGQPEVGFEESEREADSPDPPRAHRQVRTDPPLMSAATSAAVDSAFNTLAHTVLVHNARTLDDLVREMLQPLLKTWLDDNLPGLVERLVRAEIERLSRGRG